LSDEAAFLVLDILKDNPRPGQGFRKDWINDPLPVYWKTGTSYAFRDAWSIAIFGPYVLGVWVGNFDGSGDPAFVGRKAAAPLLFEMVDAIKSGDRAIEHIYKRGMEKLTLVEVCAVSGQLPGPYCPHTISTWFIPGKSPIKTCEIHREVTIDTETGLRACTRAMDGTRKEVYEFWSSDLLKIFKIAGIPRRVPPPYNPQCLLEARAKTGIPPKITSPRKGLTYSLRATTVGREKIPLAAVTDADTREVYWFIDEKFLGRSERNEPFLWSPSPGDFIVRVVDDHGRSDVRGLKVTVVE
jgi:penicillin-binding protein 1C